MAMAAAVMVTATIGSAVATMGKAKAEPGVVPTGTITMGMAVDLVPIKGSRQIAATLARFVENRAGFFAKFSKFCNFGVFAGMTKGGRYGQQSHERVTGSNPV